MEPNEGYETLYSVSIILGAILISGAVFLLIRSKKWNPWWGLTAILPLLALGIIYLPKEDNSVFLHAYEEVTGQPFPDKVEIAEKSGQPDHELDDHGVFAAFEVQKQDAQKVKDYFTSRLAENRAIYPIPKEVKAYLSRNPSKKIVSTYHERKKEGLELYGAVFSDQKTVLIFHSTW